MLWECFRTWFHRIFRISLSAADNFNNSCSPRDSCGCFVFTDEEIRCVLSAKQLLDSKWPRQISYLWKWQHSWLGREMLECFLAHTLFRGVWIQSSSPMIKVLTWDGGIIYCHGRAIYQCLYQITHNLCWYYIASLPLC